MGTDGAAEKAFVEPEDVEGSGALEVGSVMSLVLHMMYSIPIHTEGRKREEICSRGWQS